MLSFRPSLRRNLSVPPKEPKVPSSLPKGRDGRQGRRNLPFGKGTEGKGKKEPFRPSLSRREEGTKGSFGGTEERDESSKSKSSTKDNFIQTKDNFIQTKDNVIQTKGEYRIPEINFKKLIRIKKINNTNLYYIVLYNNIKILYYELIV